MPNPVVDISGEFPPFYRIAVISMHTSPTAALGQSANGGLNVYVREVCNGLSDRGVATDVYTRTPRGHARPAEHLAPRSRVIYLEAGTEIDDKSTLAAQIEPFTEAVARYASLNGLAYDAIYSHYWLSGEVACRLRDLWGIGWAHMAHTLGAVKNASLAPGAHPEPAARLAAEAEIIRSADLLIANTEVEASSIASQVPIRPNVAVVPPGVNLERFKPRDRARARRRLGYGGERLLVFAGRLERLKGAEIAIRSFARIAAAHADVRLLVIGADSRHDGESERNRLEAIARGEGIDSRVSFLGAIPQAELPWYMAAAEACLMPSYSESFGLVSLEAQACGCPVIASAACGLRSAVRDGVTGFLIDGDSVDAYAARINDLLEKPDLSLQMGRRGVLLAQRFSWSRTVDRIQRELFALPGREHSGQAPVHAGALQE